MLDLITALLLAGAPAEPSQCKPIAGADALLSASDIQWIIAGEMHGTAESPAIFGDLVCAAAQSRKVVVGLEFPMTMQPALDRYLRSDGNAAAERQLLSDPFWSGTFHDGRSSEAMFDLVNRLRQLYARKVIAGVVAFQPTNTRSSQAYEQAMAERLETAAGKDLKVIALAGNIHALKTHWRAATTVYMPMAGYLPGPATATINIEADGGMAWMCYSMTDCANKSIGSTSGKDTRQLVYGRSPDRAYSGVLFTGVPATGSPPKVP